MRAKAEDLSKHLYAVWKPWGTWRVTGPYIVQIHDVSVPLSIDPAKGVVPMITIKVRDIGYEHSDYTKRVPITELSNPVVEYPQRNGLSESDPVIWTNNGSPQEGVAFSLLSNRVMVGLHGKFGGYDGPVAAPYQQVEKVVKELDGHKAGDSVSFGKNYGKIVALSKSYVKVGWTHTEQSWEYPVGAKPVKKFGFVYLPEKGLAPGPLGWGLTDYDAPPAKVLTDVEHYSEKWVPRTEVFSY